MIFEKKKSLHIFKNTKILVLDFFLIITFIIFLLKLYSMQIIEGKKYRKQSITISSQTKTIPAQRGEIYDRDANMPLVVNTDSFAVDLVPAEIPKGEYDSVTSRLANFLGISKKTIDKRVPLSMRNSYSSITIRSNVSFEKISNIAENITDLPGISWVSRPKRNYLMSGSFSHIIGYVGDITKEEMKLMYNKGYTKNSIIGKTGIEKQYDNLLQGVPGSESKTVDVKGRVISDKPIVVPPQPGKNLVLTIDSRIQTLVEKTIGKRVGAAVVLRPATGEVLAMVSYPNFDSNIFTSDDSSEEYKKLVQNKNKPLLNRAVSVSYPPASTFKVIMTTACLAEKAFPPDKKIECKGHIVYGGRVFHCWLHDPGHGWLDLKNALAQSCDIYFWTLGRDYLGINKISYYAKLFGLGSSAQIDLPTQTTGFVPTPEWKERHYHSKWLGGDTMSVSIGQGYTLVSPLQMADVVAMVANAGVIYKPHLLKEIRDPVTNKVISEVKPEILHRTDISKDVWKTVQEDMRYTVTNGSAQYPLHNKIVKMAAKTGTAQVTGYKDSWHSWLIAYAPFDGPPEDQVAVAVIIEACNPWEWWAPYATNIIMQGIFAKQTYNEAVDALGFRYLVRPKKQRE